MSSGVQLSTVTIAADGADTRAQFVPAANMLCCSLRDRGHELLDPGHGLEAYAQRGKTMGIPLLHPWANRLSQRGYEAAGRSVTLPGPEGRYPLDPNGLPMHGALPADLVWELSPDTAADSVRARLRWDSSQLLELFPFVHELVLEATVGDGALSVATTISATGSDRVPVSFGFHPYLKLPAGPRSGWRVSLGASQRLLLDERMIPTGERERLTPTDFELAQTSWDDALAGLGEPPTFTVSAAGSALSMTFSEGFDFAQVYAPPGQDFICFEPMTAPADALNSGTGLIVLEPGGSHRTRFDITARVNPTGA